MSLILVLGVAFSLVLGSTVTAPRWAPYDNCCHYKHLTVQFSTFPRPPSHNNHTAKYRLKDCTTKHLNKRYARCEDRTLQRQYILSLETIYFVSGRSLCLLEFFFVLQKVIFMSPMQPGFYCMNCLQSGPFLKQYTGPQTRRPESTIFIVAKIKKFKSYFEKFVIITSRVLQNI